MLSTKDLVFKNSNTIFFLLTYLKEYLVRKLVDCYIDPYIINKVVSTSAVKLQLLTLMRIHPVMNVSQIVCVIT